MGKHDDAIRLACAVIGAAMGIAAFVYVLWVGTMALLWGW